MVTLGVSVIKDLAPNTMKEILYVRGQIHATMETILLTILIMTILLTENSFNL